VILINTSDFRHIGVSGGQSAKSSGMVSVMSPTPPSPITGPPATAAPVAGPSGGGVGPIVWFLAVCHRCGGHEFAEPYRDDVERDDWAARHVETTGHVVLLSTDVPADYPAPPAIGLQRTEDRDGFRFLCAGAGAFCKRWNGPYDTPQLALAAARAHRCEPVR
jgi:hypothetical protein